MDIPILTEGGSYSYFSVVVALRRLPAESVNEWLMPSGRPRTDWELATEILVAVRGAQSADHTAPVREFDVPQILELDQAAALVVSTFLWVLPRLSKRVPGTDPQRTVEHSSSRVSATNEDQRVWSLDRKHTRPL